MPQSYNPVPNPAPGVGGTVRLTELPLHGRQPLWLMRMFIAARLDYARVQSPIAAVAPSYSRAIPVLVCHMLLEVSRYSARRLQVAGPCYGSITDDEMRFLAAADLAQMHDPRLPDLLGRLCGLVDGHPDLAPVLAATRKLGDVLMQEGLRVGTCHLLPSGELPAFH